LKEYGYYLLEDNYIDVNKKINFSDDLGYKYFTSLKHIFVGHTPNIVGNSNPYSCQNISLWLYINHKDFVLKSSSFNGASKKLKWICNTCGKEFESSWNHIYCGEGCRYCKYNNQIEIMKKCATKYGSLQEENPEIAEEWDYEKNIKTPNDYSSHNGYKAWWICKECGLGWCTSISHRTKDDSGCPHCSRSKGERKVKEYLEYNGIEYIQQYRFNDCRDKQTLPFDFYLPHQNICIEYQGEQHYKISFFNNIQRNNPDIAENLFEYVKKHDCIKQNYCAVNNIKLIQIPYTKIKSIQLFLDESLKFHTA